jgi:hypothetical protein
VIESNVRLGKGGMNSCRTNFDGHRRVESSNSHLKRLETDVFVGENTKLSSFADTDSDTTGQVVLVGSEPSITLGLFEDVMQDGIVSVVIHGGGR